MVAFNSLMIPSNLIPRFLRVISLIRFFRRVMDLSATRIPPSDIRVYPKNFTSEHCLTPLFSLLTLSFNLFSIKSIIEAITRSPAFLLLT